MVKVNNMERCSSCGSENIKQYGPYAGRVSSGGDVPKLGGQVVSYKCFECEHQEFEKYLTEGVRIVTSHIVKVQRDLDCYRVIVRFVSDIPEKGALIKEFYVWLSNVYVQDYLEISKSSKETDYLRAAVLVAEEEYRKMGQVPSYSGVDCRNSWGCKIVESAETYVYPFTKAKQNGS